MFAENEIYRKVEQKKRGKHFKNHEKKFDAADTAAQAWALIGENGNQSRRQTSALIYVVKGQPIT